MTFPDAVDGLYVATVVPGAAQSFTSASFICVDGDTAVAEGNPEVTVGIGSSEESTIGQFVFIPPA